MATSHTVEVACQCEDIEDCVLEKYISDVRILAAEYQRLRNRLDAIARLANAN